MKRRKRKIKQKGWSIIGGRDGLYSFKNGRQWGFYPYTKDYIDLNISSD